MKLTIYIDDNRAPALVQFLSELAAKLSTVEASAPSLDEMVDAAQAKADALSVHLDAAISKIENR